MRDACEACGEDMPMGVCDRCAIDAAIDRVTSRGVYKDSLVAAVITEMKGRVSPHRVAARLEAKGVTS